MEYISFPKEKKVYLANNTIAFVRPDIYDLDANNGGVQNKETCLVKHLAR